ANTYGEISRINEDTFCDGPSSSYLAAKVEGANTYGETNRVNEDMFRDIPSSSYPTIEVEAANTYAETSTVNDDMLWDGPSSPPQQSLTLDGGSNAAETSPRRRLSFKNLASAQ
ncbi:hypothetical protein KI387_015684, partial [Taxus chinensis]